MFETSRIKLTDLSVIARDQISELHNLIIDGGAVSLLNNIVGCPPLALLHHPSLAYCSPCHLALLHDRSGHVCTVGGAWLQLLDWQLVSTSHHNRDSGEDVAVHQRLCVGDKIRSSAFVSVVGF